jgi:hypothetical protein
MVRITITFKLAAERWGMMHARKSSVSFRVSTAKLLIGEVFSQ